MSLGPAARELAREFRNAAKELDELSTGVNVTRYVSSTAAVTGSAIAIVAGLGILATGGAALPVFAASYGGVVSAVGGLTSSGASIVGGLITGTTMSNLEKKFQKFQKLYKEYNYNSVLMEGAKAVGSAAVQAKGLWDSTNGLRKAAQNGRACTTCSQNLTTAEAASTVLKGATKTFLLTNALSAGLSIYEVVDSVMALSKKSGCPAGELLREYAAVLDRLARLEEGG